MRLFLHDEHLRLVLWNGMRSEAMYSSGLNTDLLHTGYWGAGGVQTKAFSDICITFVLSIQVEPGNVLKLLI